MKYRKIALVTAWRQYRAKKAQLRRQAELNRQELAAAQARVTALREQLAAWPAGTTSSSPKA